MGLSAAFDFLKAEKNEHFVKIKHDTGSLVAAFIVCPPAKLSSTTSASVKQQAPLSAHLLVTRSMVHLFCV